MQWFSAKTWMWLAAAILISGAGWIYLSRAEVGSQSPANPPVAKQGFPAPDFDLVDANGKSRRLSELRGRPVIVNVWASWCPPCRAEMPALQRLYQDFQPRGLEILAVNSTSQDTPEAAQAFVAQQGLTFPVLFDQQGEVKRLYHVDALPSTYFIDAQGIIQDVVIGGPMSEALLRIRAEQLLDPVEKEKP